jgi:hypothetical protein
MGKATLGFGGGGGDDGGSDGFKFFFFKSQQLQTCDSPTSCNFGQLLFST